MSVNYGLQSTGFFRMRLEDVKGYFEKIFVQNWGEVRTDPESTSGQIIGVFSEAVAKWWEQIENVYFSQYPNGAVGVALDNVVAYNGLIRLAATRTMVQVALYSTNYPVTVPAGTIISETIHAAKFSLVSETIIEKTNAIDAYFTPAGTAIGVYIIQINTQSFRFPDINNSTGTESKNYICGKLKEKIDAAGLPITTSVSGDILRIISDDLTTEFSADAGSNMLLSRIATLGLFESQVRGAIPAIQNTLTGVETPVASLDSVNNIQQGAVGRGVETDTALRTRRVNSIRIAGAAVLDAIRARLLQYVPDISQTYVLENPTNATINGMPAHSIQCIVVGPNTAAFKQKVAEQIWAVKAAGILTFGGVDAPITKQVVDSQGISHDISFCFPTNKYFWAKVTITPNAEEELPLDYAIQIQSALVKYGEGLQIGADVIFQRLFTPIFSIPGIKHIDLQIAITANTGDTPNYGTDDIVIGPTAVAVFATTRVQVL